MTDAKTFNPFDYEPGNKDPEHPWFGDAVTVGSGDDLVVEWDFHDGQPGGRLAVPTGHPLHARASTLPAKETPDA